MKQIIKNHIKNSIEAKKLIMNNNLDDIKKVSDIIIKSLKQGGKIIWFGNGGSAADAQHLDCEFICKFQKNRIPLPSISLTTNTSILTAISNDYFFDAIFSRQLRALGKSKDVAIGISTSGESMNVYDAIREANSMGLVTVALTGETGGKLVCADIVIKVPSKETAIIQECHIMIGHIICKLVEEFLFDK